MEVDIQDNQFGMVFWVECDDDKMGSGDMSDDEQESDFIRPGNTHM